MSSFEDRFRELLRNKQLWGRIAGAFAKHVPNGWENLNAAERILAARGFYVVDDEYQYVEDELFDALAPVFQKYIVDEIGELAPITAADLASIAIAQLTGLSWKRHVEVDTPPLADEPIPSTSEKLMSVVSDMIAELPPESRSEFFGSGIIRFGAFARLEIRIPRRGTKRFSMGEWVPEKTDHDGNEFEDSLEEEQDCDDEDPRGLWVSHTDLSLDAEIVEQSFDITLELKGYLYGGCSERAMPTIEDRIGPIIESVAKTARLSATMADKEKGKEPILISILADVSPEEQSEENRRRPASISFLTKGAGGRVLRTCLDAYFYGAGHKKDIMERLSVATRRLVEADGVSNSGITLSMSFAAIEALICEGTEDKTKLVSDYVPTLLQPNSQGRTQKGERLKKYYSLRSKLVHGSTVDVTSQDAEVVRCLAAGVIRAVIAWRERRTREGFDTSWREFLNELKHASGDGKKFEGGDDDLSELLPE
jgi:hypothetical protein